ncbi:MAG: hypothetical protein SWX82_30810 [Cyanobacteriota bacterium]|nr:hypothetical protein [Cyanobacteriota bacterium]
MLLVISKKRSRLSLTKRALAKPSGSYLASVMLEKLAANFE